MSLVQPLHSCDDVAACVRHQLQSYCDRPFACAMVEGSRTRRSAMHLKTPAATPHTASYRYPQYIVVGVPPTVRTRRFNNKKHHRPRCILNTLPWHLVTAWLCVLSSSKQKGEAIADTVSLQSRRISRHLTTASCSLFAGPS